MDDPCKVCVLLDEAEEAADREGDGGRSGEGEEKEKTDVSVAARRKLP